MIAQVVESGCVTRDDEAYPSLVRVDDGSIICGYSCGGGSSATGSTDWARSTDDGTSSVRTRPTTSCRWRGWRREANCVFGPVRIELDLDVVTQRSRSSCHIRDAADRSRHGLALGGLAAIVRPVLARCASQCNGVYGAEPSAPGRCILDYHGWLERVVRGVYRRPLPESAREGTDTEWQVALVSLQSIMNCHVHLGGESALGPGGTDPLHPTWSRIVRSCVWRGAGLATAPPCRNTVCRPLPHVIRRRLHRSDRD